VKLALVSLNDSTDVLEWSGLNYHIARSLERAGATLVRVGPLTHPWTIGMKWRRSWYGLWREAYHANMEASALDAFGAQARGANPGRRRCRGGGDVVDRGEPGRAARAGDQLGRREPHRTGRPCECYFERLSAHSARDAKAMGQRGRAERTAGDVRIGVGRGRRVRGATTWPLDRVAVVPFGANFETLSVERRGGQRDPGAPAPRAAACCGSAWTGERKRGDLVIEIAQRIEAHGIPGRSHRRRLSSRRATVTSPSGCRSRAT
jgi:hypothetical protein